MNPFKDWTPQMVEDYNRRKKDCGDGLQLVNAPVKPVKAWKDPYAILKPRKPLLNKTETRFLNILKADHPLQYIGIQSMTFRLAHDLRYTPDFWMVAEEEGECMTFWEVKGPFIREDGMVKLKTAAAMFPMFVFILAQEQEKYGPWTTKTIPPL